MSVLRCIHCNYQLQQIAATRCPECGNEFDPADEMTVNRGRQMTDVARWSLKPAGRWSAAGLVAGSLLGAWFARLPPGMHDRTAINGALITLLGLVWMGWFPVRYWLARINGWRSEWFATNRSAYAWPGIFAIVVGMAILFGGARWLAFRLSEPALDRIGNQLIQLRKSSPKDQWLGLFRATSIRSVPGGAIFTTTREEDGESGFEYLPGLDPKRPTWNSRQYLADGWWTWREERGPPTR